MALEELKRKLAELRIMLATAMPDVLRPGEVAALLVQVQPGEHEDRAVIRTIAETGWKPRILNKLLTPILIVSGRKVGDIVYTPPPADTPDEYWETPN